MTQYVTLRNGICMALFFVLFAIGLYVNADGIDRTQLYGWPLYVISKTVTNLSLICFVCSFAGNGYAADCIMRAMIIEAVLLTGSVGAFPESMINNTTPQQYGVVAGLVMGWATKTAIEDQPVQEFVKGFGFAKKKETP